MTFKYFKAVGNDARITIILPPRRKVKYDLRNILQNKSLIIPKLLIAIFITSVMLYK